MLVGQRLSLALGKAAVGQPLDEAVGVECDGLGHGPHHRNCAGARQGANVRATRGETSSARCVPATCPARRRTDAVTLPRPQPPRRAAGVRQSSHRRTAGSMQAMRARPGAACGCPCATSVRYVEHRLQRLVVIRRAPGRADTKLEPELPAQPLDGGHVQVEPATQTAHRALVADGGKRDVAR